MSISASLLSKFIFNIDEKLKFVAATFSSEKIDFDTLTSNEAFITYERTVSSYANSFLTDLFKAEGFDVLLSVNEFPIKFKNGITTEWFEENLDRLGLSKKDRDRPWTYCVVDGLFKIQKEGVVKHVFIEYKLNNDFIYSDLAIDYLKFKSYTKNYNKNMIFVFAICKKEENYPSIILDDTKEFLELNKDLSLKDISDYRVFVYEKRDDVTKDVLDDKIIDDFSLIDISLKRIKKMNYLKPLSDEEKLFVDSMYKYNSNIIKSRLIRDNYMFIKSCWDGLLSSDLFDKRIINEYIIDGQYQTNAIIENGCNYNNYLEDEIGSQNKKKSLEESNIRGSSFVSSNVLIFIDYFCELNNFSPKSKMDLGSYSFGRGKNKVFVDNEKVIASERKKIDIHYGDDKEKVYKLGRYTFCLLYYLVNVLPLIYETDSNGQLIDADGSASLHEEKLKLFNVYKRVYKKIYNEKYYDNFIEFEKDYDYRLKKLFSSAINKY